MVRILTLIKIVLILTPELSRFILVLSPQAAYLPFRFSGENVATFHIFMCRTLCSQYPDLTTL